LRRLDHLEAFITVFPAYRLVCLYLRQQLTVAKKCWMFIIK